MIATPGAWIRVVAIAFLAVILQLSGFGPLRFFGGHPDIVPLVVAAVAIYAGSVAGATMGFVTGFLLDLAVGSTMGVSSLVLSAVGYGVGRFREVRDPAHGLLAIPVGAAATLAWVTAFAAVSFMLDVGALVNPLVFRDMLVTVLLNTILAIPVFAACRWALRPVLVIDPLDRRRRRSTPRETGPLGLRGLGA